MFAFVVCETSRNILPCFSRRVKIPLNLSLDSSTKSALKSSTPFFSHCVSFSSFLCRPTIVWSFAKLLINKNEMWDKQLGCREKWCMERFAVATRCCQIDPSSISRHSCGKDVIAVQSCQTTSDLTASNSSFWRFFPRFDISLLNFKHSLWGTSCFVAPVVKVSYLKERVIL